MIRLAGWPARWQAKLDRALLDAVCWQRHERMEWLLMLGADPDVAGWCDFGLVSALSAACIRQDGRMIGLLLAYGADVGGSKDEPQSPWEHLASDSDGVLLVACRILMENRRLVRNS